MRRKWHHRVAGGFRRAAGICMAVLAGALVYLGTVGCPDWLSEYLLSQANTGRFLLTSDHVRFHPLKGLVLRDAKMFAKGIVGPPCLEAEEATATINLWDAIRRKPSLRDLTLRRGVYMVRFARHPFPGERHVPLPWTATFDLVLEDMIYEKIFLKDVRCRVKSRGTDITIHITSAILGRDSEEKNLVGTATFDRVQRVLTGKIETSLDPQLLLEHVSEHSPGPTERLITDLEFGGLPPRTALAFSREFGEDGRLNVDGEFWMRDCSYRGVDVLRADGSLTINATPTDADIWLHPLVIVRPEGLATLDLRSYPQRQQLEFSVESSMAPRALTRMAGILTNAWFTNVCFEGNVRVTAGGRVDLANPSSSHSRVAIRARDIGYGDVMSDECSFDVISTGATHTVTNITGRLYDGAIGGNMTIVTETPDAPGRYQTRAWLRNADFARVVKAVNPEAEKDYAGRFSLRLEQAGPIGTNHTEHVTGEGTVRVREGRVFMLPIFGGLSKHMAKLVPGLDFVLRQGDLTLDYTLAAGKIQSDNVSVEGDVLSLSGHGDYFLSDRIDFLVQVKLMRESPIVGRLLRLITWPLSKLFEFKVAGTRSEPVWYPVNFSRDLLERLGLRQSRDRDEDAESEDETP